MKGSMDGMTCPPSSDKGCIRRWFICDSDEDVKKTIEDIAKKI